MSHKDYSLFSREHPEGDEHVRSLHEAGGFLYVCCESCQVVQSVDELEAIRQVGHERDLQVAPRAVRA